MAQDGKMHGSANPPFATKNGAPQQQGSTSDGGHDFIADNTNVSGQGPGYPVHDRPQSEAKKEVEPNPQEIPEGGPVLKADPKPVSNTIGGGSTGGVQGVSQTPFKGLR